MPRKTIKEILELTQKIKSKKWFFTGGAIICEDDGLPISLTHLGRCAPNWELTDAETEQQEIVKQYILAAPAIALWLEELNRSRPKRTIKKPAGAPSIPVAQIRQVIKEVATKNNTKTT